MAIMQKVSRTENEEGVGTCKRQRREEKHTDEDGAEVSTQQDVSRTPHTAPLDQSSSPHTIPRSAGGARSLIFDSTDQRDIETTDDDTSLSTSSSMAIHDILYGQIEFEPFLKAVIDTQPFQRLRNLKQLGCCPLVYPGAVHTRFEHSIGVAHRAAELAKKIKTEQPGLGITNSDVLCVKLAGLCHDLGHGPYSHLFPSFLARVADKMDECPAKERLTAWCHEEMSCAMLDLIFDHLRARGIDPSRHLSDRDVTFVREMIVGGAGERKGREQEKSFMYEIVNNVVSGFDVDRLDYLERDQKHALSLAGGSSFSRIISVARVCKVKDDAQPDGFRRAICLPEKAACDARRVFATRALMHDQVYQHRAVVAGDDAMCRILCLANDDVRIKAGPRTTSSIAMSALDPQAFANLTDGVVDLIVNCATGGADLEEAQRLLQLGRRAAGTYVESVRVAGQGAGLQIWESKGGCKSVAAQIAAHAVSGRCARSEEAGAAESEAEDGDIIVLKRYVHQGAGEVDPLTKMHFFARHSMQDPAMRNGECVAYPLQAGGISGFEAPKREFVVLCKAPARSARWMAVLCATAIWSEGCEGCETMSLGERGDFAACTGTSGDCSCREGSDA